jgi:beta-glucosidase
MLNKPISVKAGKPVKIQVDYFQKTDMAVMQFDIVKNYTPTESQLLAEVGDADVVVFVGGISPSLEGEEMKVSEPGFKGGDRTDIELPQAQRKVMEMLHRAGKRVVFVNCSGSAIAMVPETENAESILQAWYPGERGGEAVAKVLFGEVNPSGKLPVTFYKSTSDLPDFLDYTMKNRTYRYFKGEALFPFGHGLSYTSYEYGKPTLKKVKSEERKVKNSSAYSLNFSLSNKGNREGTEVAQVYIRRMDDAEGPIKTLKAFKRITLKAGEKQQVTISLPRQSFEGWDSQTNTMRVVPGKYQIFVGLHGFNDRRLDNPGQGGQNNKGGGKPEYRSPKRQGPVYPGRIRKDLHPAGTTVLRYHAADLANQHNCGKHTRCRRKQGCHSRSQHLL